MSTFRNNISWRVTGFDTREGAESALEAEIAWFNRTFNAKEWSFVSTVQGTPYGWAAEFTANKGEII